jgi:hypothetical protein
MMGGDPIDNRISAAALQSSPGPVRNGQLVFDIIDTIGITRGLRELLAGTIKSIDLLGRGRDDLAQRQLEAISTQIGNPVGSCEAAIKATLLALIGPRNHAALQRLIAEADRAEQLNQQEFSRMRSWMRGHVYGDFFDRQLDVLRSYLKGYEQLNQTWIYADHGEVPNASLAASTRDLSKIQKFYGDAFEQLASGLTLPASINNILTGRPFDAFELMDLRQYITTDKAGRARCLESSESFAPLFSEFDSTLRNGSHHRGFRLKPGAPSIIQYRTGDGQQWREISYTHYLWRCNRITICSMLLLGLQMHVLGLEIA